jgi:hypothetical protein
MIRALFAKELRTLRPFLFLGLAFLLIELLDKLLSPFETQSLAMALAPVPIALAMSQLLLGFALGSGLLVREIDDGTLNFLDGLPVTRGAVFAAKVFAAMLVLTIYPLGLLLLHALLHLGARESLDAAVHPGLLLTLFGLSMLVTLVGLGLGMLLGYLRYLSWLVLSLCAIGVLLLKDKVPSLGAAFDTFDLLTLRFVGAHWQLPMAAIWTHLGAALLCFLLAFGLFKAAGAMQARVRRARRWLLPSTVVAMVIAIIAGLAGVARQQASNTVAADKDVPDGVHFAPAAAGHASTTHFTFSYPALSGERLRPFIKGADKVFADVAAMLGTDGGAPIDVDLSGTIENHAGTAYLDRIRMHALGAGSLGVLAHETVHVFAARLAGGESGIQLDGMMVFNEGLAQWVENRLTDEVASEEQELAAAVVSKRRLLAPRLLADHAAFAAAVDDGLKYPLGAIIIDKLVQRHGAKAPKAVLETLARADFPRDLEGYVLWQAAFQLSGFDLDLVFDDYARHLKRLELKFADQIALLPRPRGSLVKTGAAYDVALRLDLPLPDGAFPIVRLRPGMNSGTEQYRTSYSKSTVAGKMLARVPASIITRDQVCFQPGLIHGGITIYEPWTCLPVGSASVAAK